MLLKNFWRVFRIVNTNTLLVQNSTNPAPGIVSGYKDISGNTASCKYAYGVRFNAWSYTQYGASNALASILSGCSSVVGSSDTEVSPDDYCLANDITSSFANVQNTVTWSDVGDDFNMIISFTGTNSTDSDITIREVGIKKSVCASANATLDQGSFNNVSTVLLIGRMVLDTPVVVHAGDTANINVKLKMM